MALGNLANVSLRIGDIAAAEEYAERCLALERAAGNTYGIVLGLECLGQVRLARGDLAGARAALTEGLTRSRELGDAFGEAMALHQLGDCAHAEGDRVRALHLCTEALARRHELGDREDLAVSLDSVAELSADDDPDFAARLLGAVDDLRELHRLAPAQDPARRAATEKTLRAALGGPRFADAYRAGRSTPLDLLVDEALDRKPALE
jgi:tetratricopeptide (TPR) repeat protein